MTKKNTPKSKGRTPIFESGNMKLVGVRLPEGVIEDAKNAAYDAHSTLGKWIRDTLIQHLRQTK